MKGNKGFTLIELMVVIIILGILAAIAAPRYMAARDRARATEAIQQLGVIAQDIQASFQLTAANPASLSVLGYPNAGTVGDPWNPGGNARFVYIYAPAGTGTLTADEIGAADGVDQIILSNVNGSAAMTWGGDHPGRPQ